MFVLNPVSYRPTYETAVEMNDHSQEARIDLSHIDGHALLLAGEQNEGDIAAKEIGEVLDDQAKW
ncbi:hypothetical protein [Gracilibacillus alcaliphilus]|uniref:hypothetical protein n=1 Tax=Gracilibacillus alcaliphilus TaxID=1401441 RepID=UPI0019568883|nr:hypothetical protein [Gracilibacillus alcaliphilus]MBM7679084.1 hypothetical protein [Gracilibacillus alcaliphilus]